MDYRNKKYILQVGTDQLWPLIILGGFVFFASLVPTPPNDFWWHLKIGEIIFNERTIPTTNLFSWVLPPDQPFVYGAWLGELWLYTLYALGKLELVIFARNLLIGLAFWLIVLEIKRRTTSWRLGTLGIALLAGMTLNNLVLRPQIWSWIIFVLYLIILSRYADRQIHQYWLFLCPILMILWVNLHGAYILGGVVLGIFFFGESIRTYLNLEDALSWKRVGWILLVGILTGLAVFINPQGLNTVNYVINLLTDQSSQQLIVEWQSPTTQGISNITFYVSVLMMLISLAYSRRKLSPTEILLVVSFTWLAWTGVRYIIWYGMACVPILLHQIIHLPVRFPKLLPQRNYINTILAVLILVPVLMVQPWFVERFPLPERYWKMVQRDLPDGPLLDWSNPVSAVDYLQSHPGGKLFNEMGYGSYLIWAMDNHSIFIDPRVELYPFEQWEDYIRITRAARYNQILDKYGIDRILLDIDLQPELAFALETDPLWQQEYDDGYAQVWQRTETR